MVGRGFERGYVYLWLSIVLFSTIEIAVKLLSPYVSALKLGGFRFVGTGLCLLPLGILQMRVRKIVWSPRDWLTLSLLGIVGVTFALSFYHAALYYLPANVGAVVFSAHPLFVALFAVWIGQEPFSVRVLAGALFGVVGLGLIAVRQGTWSGNWPIGFTFMIIAEVAFAYYSVLVRKHMPRYGDFAITSIASLTGGALLVLLSRILEGPIDFSWISRSKWTFLYLVVGATAVPYVLYFQGLARVGAGRGSLFFFLKPVLAPLFASWILGEPLSLSLVLGALWIICGLLLEFLPRGLVGIPD